MSLSSVMNRPRVLVTGAAGYVGRLTVQALSERRAELGCVVAFDIAEVPRERRLVGVDYVAGDVRGPEVGALLREHHIDTVVHLASIIRAPDGAAPDFAYSVDVLGTRNVLEGSVAAGVKKLIITSSGAAYGYHADNPAWLDETQAVRGNDEFPYAHNKRLIEEMLASYRREHPEIEQLIFRPGTILGKNVSNPITDLFEKPAMLGVWGTDAPFVFIWDRDVVACILKGIFEGKTGIYNLAGDGVVTTPEIAARLGKPYLPLPASMLRASLWLLKHLALTQYGPEQVMFLRHRPVLDNHRLKEEFGFTPTLTSREVFELYAGGQVPTTPQSHDRAA